MRYLFIVQGEGRGHLTQAISLKQMLEHNGHEVVAVMVGKSKKRVLPDFFPEKMNTEIIQFQSPNFMPMPKGKKPFLLASILYNILLLPVYIESIFTIRRTIREQQPDIVINFYELLCGITYGVFNPEVPMVNMAHQYYFLTSNFEYTGNKWFKFYLLNLYSRFTAFNSSKILALSFRREDTGNKDTIGIVPPLLRRELLHQKSRKGNYMLGYLLNDGYMKDLKKWSESNTSEELHFFWDRRNADTTTIASHNLTMHRLNDQLFLKLMTGAKAYATTGGFESVCEAMYLNKPVLMVPTHIEQECNVMDALRSGAGVAADSFDLDKLLKYIAGHTNSNDFKHWVQSAESVILFELTAINTDAVFISI